MRRIFVLLLVLSITSMAFAQKATKQSASRADIVAKMLGEVSAKQLEIYDRKLVSFGTRNTNSTQTDPTRGIGAARDWIFNEFQKISADCGGCLEVQKQTFRQEKTRRVPVPIDLTNIVATLRGATDPERIYVVSGHYDSMCSDASDGNCDAPGANDDGSGTSAVIEMARIMSKHKFDATIIFMTVAGEEQSLLGAEYFAKKAFESKINIEAMFTNDIIGGVKTHLRSPGRNSVRVFAEGAPSNESASETSLRRSIGGENDSPSRQLGRYIKEIAEKYSPKFPVEVVYRRDRFLRGGDHIPFLENGFSAVRFTEQHEDYDHQHQNVRTEDGKFYGDTPEFVDFGYVANVVRVNIASLANLALAPAKPKNVGILTKRLTNDTDIKWDANAELDLAGYEIVWRKTFEPFWTDGKFVGNVTAYTAENMSKDNYFFGVRAVDKMGYKSPVVFPKPVR